MSGGDATVPGTSGDLSENSGDALTLLTQGKRHLLVKDYVEAVGSLGQACALLASKYGDSADECGEAYLYYGKALLELARSESGVLGDAIEGEGSSEESDEEGDSEENTKEKDEDGKTEEGESVEPDKETEKDADESKDESESTAPTCSDNGPEEEEDDVSNLKLSWEILELAKIIFARQAKDSQMKLKLADVFLNLGEVSLESEAYEQAIQDLLSCLKIQKEYLESDDRRIAETFYSLGMAYSLNNEFDESMKNYMNAQELLELRVSNLKAKHASGDKPDESDAFYTLEGEIEELNGIIPDVKDKITELKEMKAETIKAVSEMLKDGTAGNSSKDNGEPPKPAVSKPASDISHLIRKKQKNEQSAKADSSTDALRKSPSPDETIPAKIQKSE